MSNQKSLLQSMLVLLIVSVSLIFKMKLSGCHVLIIFVLTFNITLHTSLHAIQFMILFPLSHTVCVNSYYIAIIWKFLCTVY